MRTQEPRQQGAENQQQAENGSRTLTPPPFQLQVSPAAPIQRQTQPGQEGGQQENAEQEGHEGQGGEGHAPLSQRVNSTPTAEEAVTPEWEAFARAFSHHFLALLPLFDDAVNVEGYDRSEHRPFAEDLIGEDGNVIVAQQPNASPATPASHPTETPAEQQNPANSTGATPAESTPVVANSTGSTPAVARPAVATPRPVRGRGPTPPSGRRTANSRGANRRATTTSASNPQNANAPAHGRARRPAPIASAAKLRHLFSDFHRVALMGYMRTHVIPPVLFNGGDLGNLSSGQRLALAAQILTYGTHERGDQLQARQSRVDREVNRFREMLSRFQRPGQRGRNASARPGQHPAAQQPTQQPAANPATQQPAAQQPTQQPAANPANAQTTATPATEQPQDVRQGALSQRVHAHNCGDWASYVTLYAGVRERLGAIGGAYNSFDHTGRLVLGTAHFTEWQGAALRPHAGTARRGADLPGAGTAESNDIGPLQGAQASEAARLHQDYLRRLAEYEAELARNPNTTRQPPTDPSTHFGRHSQVSWEHVMNIQPGDWLWIYNANSDTMGSHSVIFIRWMEASDRTVEGANFRVRRALCFSQHSTDSGGVEDNVLLGERFAAGAVPVTLIRHMEASNRGLTPEDLLPTQSGVVQQYWQDLNASEMAALGRRRNVQHSFDRNAFVEFLQSRNTQLINGLAAATIQQSSSGEAQHVASEEQIAAFRTANSNFSSQARGAAPTPPQTGGQNNAPAQENSSAPAQENASAPAQQESAATERQAATANTPTQPQTSGGSQQRGRRRGPSTPVYHHHETPADIGLRQLVMLYQRLVQVTENARVRNQNIQMQVEGENGTGGLNRRHRSWEENNRMRSALNRREQEIWDRQHQQGRGAAVQGQPHGQGQRGAARYVAPPPPFGFSIPYGLRSSDMVVNGRILDAIPEADLMQFFTGTDVPSAIPLPREVRGLIRRNPNNGRPGQNRGGAQTPRR